MAHPASFLSFAEATEAARQATGEYFTPEPIVRFIVRQTLAPLLTEAVPERPLRILEPACGAGVFLIEAYRYLLDWHLQYYRDAAAASTSVPPLATAARVQRNPQTGDWELTADERKRILLASLFGVELQSRWVEHTKTALAELAAGGDPARVAELRAALSTQIRCGDALVEPEGERPQAGLGHVPAFAWRTEFPEPFQGHPAGFDAVLGNPPYVNIRRLTRLHGEAVKRYLQQHYHCARGSYDLYVLFLEKAFELLRPGGVCGFIVPNKLATLDYARPCRTLLLEQTTILQIVDLADSGAFAGAGVYPYVLIWRKQLPPAEHRIATVPPASVKPVAREPGQRLADRLTDAFELRLRQADLSAAAGLQIHGDLPVETRVRTQPLSEVAELHSGSTGFQAAQIAAALQEGGQASDAASYEFIVSGNIDRYVIRSGRVRFMKRQFDAPRLPAHTAGLTRRKNCLFAGPKIVIAGMSLRLEAAWDPGGRALGVQVYAVVPQQLESWYLLGLLNSKLMSYLFRLRFQAKRLAGGYLAINKSQLAQLPIRVPAADDPQANGLHQRLEQLVGELLADRAGVESQASSPQHAGWQRPDCDAEIDALVYQLYGLTDAEIATVEASIADVRP